MSSYIDPATALRIAHTARAVQLKDAERSRQAREARTAASGGTPTRPTPPPTTTRTRRRRPLLGWRVRPA